MKIACIGNCTSVSSELTGADVLTTAIYLARSGLDVSFVGVHNDDDEIAELMKDEGLSIELMQNASVDEFFTEENLAHLQASLKQFDYAYLTGQILSLIKEKGRVNLINVLSDLRTSGLKVVFDSNHSVASWESNEQAAEAYSEILGITDISLPNFKEEAILFNDQDVGELIARHHSLGVPEIALKNGVEPNWLSTKPKKPPKDFPIEQIRQPVDESGAGDAFNAAYLATRISGKTYCGSIEQGQMLAAQVVQQSGSILQK